MKKLTKAELMIIEINKAIDSHNELVNKIRVSREQINHLGRVGPVDLSVFVEMPYFLKRHTN